MLSSLHIENIAVIKSVDIDFACGFTAMTGETGAGKSVIIDSINLLLGMRADKELIRTGESFAMVSGVFADLSKSCIKALSDIGFSLDEDENLVIQRTVSADGRSQIKINGRAANITLLRSVAPLLVGIHGQSDTGQLVNPEKHLELVDTYAASQSILEKYQESFSKYDSVRRKISEITEKTAEKERLKEILEYQIKDIDSLGLHETEEEELVEKKVKIRNSEKIIKNSEFAFKALKGSEKGSVSYLVDRSVQALSQLAGVIPEYEGYAETLRDVLYKVDDIAEEIYAVIGDMDTDPTEALNEIESRLDKIAKLKRKYGLTVKDVLAFADKARTELEELDLSDELLEKLHKQEDALYKEALELADELHAIRSKAAVELEERVKEVLEFLDMPKVVFFASISEHVTDGKKELNPTGYDSVEFFISANRGAEPQPIARIASGGELARIMLALKSVISDKDGVMTVIFDEIDSGVSGKTARKIGVKMLSLSKTAQILCVTHSAQIASIADMHLLISKSDVNGKTETSVRELDGEGRVLEISRILGGINVTDAQRRAAKDMIEEKHTYR